MNFGTLAKRLGKLAADNSPALLAAMGVTGVLATAYLTGTASFKAAEIIREAKDFRSESNAVDGTDIPPIDLRDSFDLTWKLYVPAAATAAMTVVAIVSANRISDRRAAALASAYSLSEKALVEYKKKVVEKIGVKKERAIVDEIAQDQVNANPLSKTQIYITDKGETLCFDRGNDRYFNSDMHQLKTAELDMGFRILNEGYASESDFYDLLGLNHTSNSDDFGWNTDRKFELDISPALTDRDEPCLAFAFKFAPIPKFYRSFR